MKIRSDCFLKCLLTLERINALYWEATAQPAVGIQVLSRDRIGIGQCFDLCAYSIWFNFYLLKNNFGVQISFFLKICTAVQIKISAEVHWFRYFGCKCLSCDTCKWLSHCYQHLFSKSPFPRVDE
jgi:hypothetical protein